MLACNEGKLKFLYNFYNEKLKMNFSFYSFHFHKNQFANKVVLEIPNKQKENKKFLINKLIEENPYSVRRNLKKLYACMYMCMCVQMNNKMKDVNKKEAETRRVTL